MPSLVIFGLMAIVVLFNGHLAWGADILVVAPRDLQPGLREWKAHRQQEGRKVQVLTPRGDADAIRKQIHREVVEGETKYLLLVGDADRASENSIAEGPGVLPTHYLPARVNIHWGPERDIASDNPYADLNGDGLPELAVGRIAVETADDLRRVLSKVIAYESSNDFGDWRRRISFVGCPGNFGPMVDSLLEQASRKLTTQGIPPSYATVATYGHWRSPYCPDPRRFRDATLDQLNGGGLFWVYIGHGHCQVVDRLRTPDNQRYPILSTKDVPSLRCQAGNPIAIFLACYTGAFDFPVDSLSEQMLLSEGGPVAVYSSTRVTMPYAMTVMGGEMMNGYFLHHCPTIGDLVRDAKRNMVDGDRTDSTAKSMDTLALMVNKLSPDLRAERWEHVQMFHLFGDPSMKLPQPEVVEVESVGAISPGQKVLIRCRSPIAGECRVELVPPRDKLPIKPDPRPKFEPNEETYSLLQATYEKANDVVLSGDALDVKPGPFTVSLMAPEAYSGKGHIRVYVEGQSSFAVGHQDCQIDPPQ
jgi:hypothetical protein